MSAAATAADTPNGSSSPKVRLFAAKPMATLSSAAANPASNRRCFGVANST